MPKKKVAKLTKSQDVKTTASSSAATLTLPDIFRETGILRHVLSLVLCVNKEEDSSESPERHRLARDCASFRSVCKSWHDTTWEMMSSSAPTDVISVAQLAKIKANVASLDLSSLYGEFIKGMSTKWQHCECSDEECPDGVWAIVEHFGGTSEKFSTLVAREYKRLLVVKAVEAVSAKKTVPMWTEKCQPNKLIDVFWHAHMLSPCKYAADCMAVVGKIIDHSGSYHSYNKHKGSDYQSKRDILFKYELENFPELDYFGGRLGNDNEGTIRTILFSNNFNIAHVTDCLMDDMAGFNDCG